MPQLSFTPSEYKNAFDRVRSYVLNNNGKIEDVHDVLHEGFLRFLEKSDDPKFNLRCSYKGYLFGICKIIWMEELQRRLSEPEMIAQDILLNEQHTDQMVKERKELLIKILRRNIKNITAKCQKIFNYKAEELTCNEIAKKMSLDSGQIFRNKLYSCKSRLMTLVREDYEYKKIIEDE